MRCATALLICACGLFLTSAAEAQENGGLPPISEIFQPSGPPPEAAFDQPPTLPSAAPRMGLLPRYAPLADPRVIFFDPYFFPTHYNFRPLPYGYPPTDPGFFYGAFANPYYYQYYGPGDYYGF